MSGSACPGDDNCHARAAGCELEGNLDNAKAAVLAEVEKELKKLEEAAEAAES